MASDGRLAQAERRNYRHVGDALVRIVREEGFLTLWRGAVPTIGRAMVTNAAQLASYSQAKQSLLSSGWFLAILLFVERKTFPYLGRTSSHSLLTRPVFFAYNR